MLAPRNPNCNIAGKASFVRYNASGGDSRERRVRRPRPARGRAPLHRGVAGDHRPPRGARRAHLLAGGPSKTHRLHFNVTPPPDAAANATLYLTFAARNPNRRVSILYDSVEFRVLYGESAQLAVVDAPAFKQPHRNETELVVRAVARSAPVSEQTARELRHDMDSGQMAVDVRMRARVQFKVSGVRTRRYDLLAFCSPVVVGLSPSAARSFQSVPCDVAIS